MFPIFFLDIPKVCFNSPSPEVLQVIVHVTLGVLDADGHVWRLQHLHGELMGKGSDKQSLQGVMAADFG